jgi:hypothetical protein
MAENVPYSIDREELAAMIASHVSGFSDAIPEQFDYDLADRFIAEIEQALRAG